MRGSGPYEWTAQQVRATYFRPTLTSDRWGDWTKISGDLILLLDSARAYAEVPFEITSGWRSRPGSAHSIGLAADIRAHTSRQKFKIVESLLYVGFTRIGVYNLHVHADIDPSRPAQVMWVGKSE